MATTHLAVLGFFDASTAPAAKAFDDVVLPIAIGLGTSGGPEFSTDVTVVGSGYERRNQNWSKERMLFDLGSRTCKPAVAEQLLAFFRERKGRARGFRHRDPHDWKSCALAEAPAATDQLLGTGNGARVAFQLVKSYGSGATEHVRKITRPAAGKVYVAVGGVAQAGGWTVDTATGIVMFANPPAVGANVTAGFEYHVPVRFEIDRLEIVAVDRGTAQLPEIPLVEIRE